VGRGRHLEPIEIGGLPLLKRSGKLPQGPCQGKRHMGPIG
jgi:hypothetical protein